jgi:hypothetical protein
MNQKDFIKGQQQSTQAVKTGPSSPLREQQLTATTKQAEHQLSYNTIATKQQLTLLYMPF